MPRNLFKDSSFLEAPELAEMNKDKFGAPPEIRRLLLLVLYLQRYLGQLADPS